MGQCMSRKAAGAFAASAAVSHNRPTKMQKHSGRTPDDEDETITKLRSPTDSNKHRSSNSSHLTKGVAMSFGFKRRPAPSIASNPTAARRLANIDGNGNDADTECLATNVAPTGRSTPRLAPPKKEPNATRVSRFGFRQTQTSRHNKIADLNAPVEFTAIENGNMIKKNLPAPNKTTLSVGSDNNNRNRIMKVGIQPQVGKFTLQSTQLPRPEPIRLIESKTAKTLANNNRKVAGMYQTHEETSSKDGSLTEDSGVGSHMSGFIGETELRPDVEQLEASPAFGTRRRSSSQIRSRNLEVVVTSKNTFDVRDFDDSNDSCDSIPPPPLPQLPSVFNNSSDNRNRSLHPLGLVRERTMEYQRHLNKDIRGRKISITSSEGFSDDYGEEEKTYKDIFRSEKTFMKSTPSHQTFLKTRANQLKEDSSPPSSDEHEWGHGGEAMADEISFSLSSSDESKDNNTNLERAVPVSAAVIGSALQSLLNSSLSRSFTTSVSNDVKNVMLTIEDPKFAAMAAASNAGTLLDDETLLSPVDSISCSETEEIKKKLTHSLTDSKDINEKLSPPSPGTPTNASNSLSISDGKDDFLIDDEIADQPSLLFEDGLPANIDNTVSRNNSDATPTLVESTPKPRRKVPNGFEGSPLSVRNKKFLQSRTGSLDTLSPCESIASDDLMMDYDYSQSSGLEDFDRHSTGYPSLNETLISKHDNTDPAKGLKDWNPLIGNYVTSEKSSIGHTPRPRLLRSRAGTPSSVPDSPRSLDSRPTRLSRPTAPSSPAKSKISHLCSTGYDSDDSIRLDRVNHTAMKQDIISIKTMLLKLRRVLNETGEDILLRSETHNPFENQAILTNGIFNSLCNSDSETTQEDNERKAKIELAELRRQILFLQGQLEDKEKTVQSLQEQMIKLTNDNYHANSAPASTVSPDNQMCNAATQTERIRPISAGPSLLNSSSVDGSALVSATESFRKSQVETPSASKKTPRLWRQPGEPPSPHRFKSSSIPRRTNSRTRISASTT